MRTIGEQIRESRRAFTTWLKAFDSKEDKFINIRKIPRPADCLSDVWKVQGEKQRLYSEPGTIPLFVTLVE